jgi:hypothetical protein
MTIRTLSIAAVASGALALPPSISAAGEITLPRGTAVDVLVEEALSSRTAKVGDEFRAVLVRALWIDGQLAFPKGTVVEGRVDVVESRGAGARSGFVGVKFVRIELPGSYTEAMAARLADFGLKRTRVDVILIGRVPAQRDATEPVEDQRIKDLARFHSSETDVDVAAGTIVSLELGEDLRVPAAATTAIAPPPYGIIYLLPATVADAQRSLRDHGVYGGPIDGSLSTETRHAILQFQLRHGQVATGDLDEATLRLLDVSLPTLWDTAGSSR